jgi:hypothetical protein
MRFWVVRRQKKVLEVLPSGLGVFLNTLTIQFDDEAQRQISSSDSRRTVIPGEIIDSDTPDDDHSD